MINIEITTHSGMTERLEVEQYDAMETADIINGITKNETGNSHNVIVLADNIYSCVDIKTIKVIKQPEEEPDKSAE